LVGTRQGFALRLVQGGRQLIVGLVVTCTAGANNFRIRTAPFNGRECQLVSATAPSRYWSVRST
jgi:hypothetical protein